MSISKTKNGTYRVRKKYPIDAVKLLELNNNTFDKIFKTRREAEQAEKNFENKISELRETKDVSVFELGGEALLKKFYEENFLKAYMNGLTGKHPTPPDLATINNTKDIFRIHILPMLGDYTLNYLNSHKVFVVNRMTEKAYEYANFSTLRGYVNQVFDLAEEYDYIAKNRLAKSISKIKPTKKIALDRAKNEEDKYLSEDELQSWFHSVESDYIEGYLTEQDYALFWTTFFLASRKSESYALQWKHVDFENNKLSLVKALDRYGNEKSTKATKKTIITLPKKLAIILKNWKSIQKEELKQFNIKQTPNQLLFTYCNRKGQINIRLHIDYLNNRMDQVKTRHPELQRASPHKLRHTAATLANIYGMSISEIAKGLTNTEAVLREYYLNNEDIVEITPAEFAYNHFMSKPVGD